MKNIFVATPCTDLYRGQTFIAAVLSERDKYNLIYSFYSTPKSSNFLLNFFYKIFCGVFRIISSYYYLLISDIVYFPPMNLGIWKMRVCKFLNKKVIYEYYISMYDTFVLDRKTVIPNSKEALKLLRNDRYYQKNSHVIYLNQTEARRYSFLASLDLAKLDYSIFPLTIEERQSGYLNYFKGNDTCFNMVWWGTYIPLHGLDKLLDAFLILHGKNANYRFYIYGNDEILAKPYIEFVEKNQLTEYVFIYNDITFQNGLEEEIVKKCSLAFGAFGDSDKAKSVILNKTIEAMGMRIPVLTQQSEAYLEFFENDESIFLTKSTVEGIVERVEEISVMSSAQIDKVTKKAYTVYRNNFSIGASQKVYKDLLIRILNQ